MQKRSTLKNKKRSHAHHHGHRHTKKNSHKVIRSFESFEKEITIVFFEMLLLIKLFHWNTHSYSTHKATDQSYSSLNENMDKFMEVLLGKSQRRIHLEKDTHIRCENLHSTDELKMRIDQFKRYLVNLDNRLASTGMSNTDLLNIRDEILGDMNQFLYLLSLN
jgi:hypothetical protein